MSSIAQGLVLATAMAVSAGTIILLDLCREKYFPSPQMAQNQESEPEKQNLRSCLASGGKKGEKKKKKKTKRVQFAADVKEPRGNGEEYRREHRKSTTSSTRIQTNSCGMPANQVALYDGIMRDRSQRMEFSY